MQSNENISGIRVTPKQIINDVKGTDTFSERKHRKKREKALKRKKDSFQVSSNSENGDEIALSDELKTTKPECDNSETKGKIIDVIIR